VAAARAMSRSAPPDAFDHLLADLLVLRFLKDRAVAATTAKSPPGSDREDQPRTPSEAADAK